MTRLPRLLPKNCMSKRRVIQNFIFKNLRKITKIEHPLRLVIPISLGVDESC